MDTYPSFARLEELEAEGAFGIRSIERPSRFAIVVPHGGGIEPGTSEIGVAIAADDHSFYAFEGHKRRGNADLHITSSAFDEPIGDGLSRASETVLTVHGEGSGDVEVVYLGGLDAELRGLVAQRLAERAFRVGEHPGLRGDDRANICNRGRSGRGVQLEISLGLRRTLFASLDRDGRTHRTRRFDALVDAVRRALADR